MASYKKLDNGKWQVSFYCKDYLGNNKKYKKTGFDTKKMAKEYADNFIAKNNGTSNILLTDLFKEFLENKKPSIRENTINSYNNTYKTISTYFKGLSVNEITKKHLLDFFNLFIDKKATQKILKIHLNLAFNYATNYYNLKVNPLKNFNMITKQTIKKEKEILTLDEFKIFYEKLKQFSKLKTRVYFLLLYFTGARCGEISGLTLNDIDLKKSTIFINKTRISLNKCNSPKNNNSIRYVPLPKYCIDELKKYIDTLPDIPGLFLFSPKTVYTCLMTYYRNKGILKKGISLHSFRHSHASYLINKNIDIASISKRLGHKNPKITLDTYSHFYKQKQDKVLELLENIDI
ncbi:tyrosine-type recombinase/integrase [Oceanivirga salmonicida]|uniref:tyrosine-type recombinase/integrase n=1 Tax=Oceanivirga salmonicida TaxID=1769291 RepID=UPI0008363FE6|nr:tyrosine-type recombinase/integrase [Oceanivirga salmonicida]